MIIIHHMPPKNAHGGIQHPHWHIASVHLVSLCRSPQCHYLQRQCHHSAPYFSHGKGGKAANLQQFMFGISVIESHSYIRERKLWGTGDINAGRDPWKHRAVPPPSPRLPNNVSHLFFYSLPLSPPLARWMINSQLQSQQQLLADRPDMRIAA